MEQPGQDRIHSMDVLRASTMFLLVPVHAALMQLGNGSGGTWAVGIYWLVHVFRLPLFFAMSGFFLAFLLGRRGLAGTARNRTLRIVVPLLVGLVTLVPLMIVASQQTGVSLADDPNLYDGSPFLFEPSFLWFLWYLLIIDTIAISLFVWARRPLSFFARGMRLTVTRPLVGIGAIAAVTTLALLPAENWSVDPARDTFAPEPAALAYYALFFGLGATLCTNRDMVQIAARNAWRWSACAVAATVPAGLLFTLHNSTQVGSPTVHVAAMWIYAIATWSSLVALIGLANRYMTRPIPVARYLADASYWIYLSHMPFMVLVFATIGAWQIGAAPYFVLVTVASLGLSILSYRLFVRYTPIGRLLNGRRERPSRRAARATPATATAPAA